MTFEPFRN